MSSMDPALEPTVVLRRKPVVDELWTDEGVVVMVAGHPWGRVIRLSPLGLEVLDAIGAGTTLTELESELRERLGEPPGGGLSERVSDAVLELLSVEAITAVQGHKAGIRDVIQP